MKFKYTTSDNFINLALSGTASQINDWLMETSANKAIDGNRDGRYSRLASQLRFVFVII